MLTASASPLLAVEAMRAGATDYLIKPVAPDRLMHALRSAGVDTLLAAPVTAGQWQQAPRHRMEQPLYRRAVAAVRP